MLPQFSLTDFVNAFNQLLPDWLSFNRDSTIRQNLITAWMGSLKTISDIAFSMPAATFPATCTTNIDGWESSLGLPDPNIIATTTAQRQAQIVARLTGDVSPTPAQFELFVANLLGISASQVSTNQFLPFYMGFSRMGLDQMAPESMQFTWQIVIPPAYSSQISFVTAELQRIAPAHTIFTVIT